MTRVDEKQCYILGGAVAIHIHLREVHGTRQRYGLNLKYALEAYVLKSSLGADRLR
jgi:hypothetical protein